MSDLLRLSDVEFVKELYPRLREDDAAIERYRAALDRLPPITVARGRVLVDGFHRWQAHRREGAEQIAADDLGDITDAEILREAYKRNAKHGAQLSASDKRTAAEHLYFMLGGTSDEKYDEIADLLSLNVDVAKKYAAKARSHEKAEQQAKAWDLWLDCLTQEAIAELLGVPRKTVADWLANRESDSVFAKPPGATAEKPWGNVAHFDVWNFPAGDDGSAGHFGRMPAGVVENVLWLWTEPGDTVVDPFVGGGTTIDVAKRMGRRIWASDLVRSTPTLPITEHDITTGWPDKAPRKADLILLDPPYWQQAKGRYSDSPDDLGNMTFDDFMAAWSTVVKVCAEHLADGGRLVYIVSPTQLDADHDHHVVDHAMDMWRVCADQGLNTERRVIVTYSTQQATGQQVEWARENQRLLKLYRDLVVMR